LSQARARYEEALPIYRAIGSKLDEANCIQALGDVHGRLSELPQARARYEEALRIYRAIGNRLGEANCIRSLGDLCVEEGDEAQALSLLNDAIACFHALGLPAGEASTINSIGNLYNKQRARSQAIAEYTRALALALSPSPSTAGYILLNRADQYIQIDDAESAARDLAEAAKLQPDNAYLFLRLGELALLQNDRDHARRHFAAALERFPHLNDAHFGLGRADLLSSQPADALDHYRAGLAVTDAASGLDHAIADLEKLKRKHPALAGVTEALTLLRNWRPQT
jgi:tetratricopeptide (TPR) repeat protein